jgi:formyl-CoA transferase
MGGSASTTGTEDGAPTVTGAQIGDSGTGVHCVVGILAALLHREHSGRGQRVEVAMQDSVLNLCRVKLRDQQRLSAGPLKEFPNETFGDYVPRAGNASGGGQPGAALRCSPGGANDYVYVIIQPQGWEPLMRLCGREDLITHPQFATPEARLKCLGECFSIIEKWTKTKTKFEVMDALNEVDVPCGPILSMKDLIEDESMFDRGYLVELDHPERGKYVQLGCPITLSASPVEVERSPLLGEHTEEILDWLGRSPAQIAALKAAGAV